MRSLAQFVAVAFGMDRTARHHRKHPRCICHPHEIELGFYTTGCFEHDRRVIL